MYVGNLPYDVTELELRDLFAAHGEVTEVAVVMDRETGRPRGFAFVTMGEATGMESAIRELDGKEFNGRVLTVNEARPREERPSFAGSGGGGGDYNRGKRKSGGGSRKGNRSQERW